jgi:pimeloyl-ACP methyl ester carboxylesterase
MDIVSSKDGTQIAYDEVGSGDVLILVDGALTARNSGSKPKLANLLGQYFTVYSYDRRGRGDSGDTLPYSIGREIEDIEAVIDKAGGKAYLYGHSSGAALALEASAALPNKIKKLVMYEAPYSLDQEAQKSWKLYRTELSRLTEAKEYGDALALFMIQVGTPPQQIESMRHSDYWGPLEKLAYTLPYDAAALGEFSAIPEIAAKKINIPTLLLNGSKSFGFMIDSAKALSALMPNAEQITLDGETHEVNPEVIAPVIAHFLSST